MKDIGIGILLSVLVSAAAPIAATEPADAAGASHQAPAAASFTTQKSTEQFASCFGNTQDHLRQAWWFVPKEDGGTFSNLGAKNAAPAYFVVVSDRGQRRQVRLEGVGASLVNRAVLQCI
jgi:hypothetical protein